MQNDESELLKQSNKKHKGLRDKLKKRRSNEKKAKKEKKEKKKKSEKKKAKRKEKGRGKLEDPDANPEKALRRHIKKLLKLVGEEIDDFIVLLENVDAGAQVELEEIEQENVKKRLKKIFKTLKLRKNEITNEYYKDPQIHTYSIQEKIEKIVEELEEEESSSESEDDDDKDIAGDKRQSELEPPIVKKQMTEGNQANVLDLEEKLRKINEMAVNAVNKEIAKDAAPKDGKDWKDFLDDKFAGVLEGEGEGEEYSRLRGDKKKKVPKKSKEELERDTVIRDFMDKYNETYRSKSLLDIHRENKAKEKKKSKNNNSSGRRPFDREIDLSAGRIDSKRLKEVLHDKKHSLSVRFGDSQIDRNFI